MRFGVGEFPDVVCEITDKIATLPSWVIANTDVKQHHAKSAKRLRDRMFAAERDPNASVNALPGGVFSHVEDYAPLAGESSSLFIHLYGATFEQRLTPATHLQ
jgi:hypothetical protein